MRDKEEKKPPRTLILISAHANIPWRRIREEMRPAHRYMVLYKIPGVHRRDRYAVLDYLGRGAYKDELDFSGRPLCGTQTLDAHHIGLIAEVDNAEKIVCGDIAYEGLLERYGIHGLIMDRHGLIADHGKPTAKQHSAEEDPDVDLPTWDTPAVPVDPDPTLKNALQIGTPKTGITLVTTSLSQQGVVKLRVTGGGAYVLRDCVLGGENIYVCLVPRTVAHPEEQISDND